MRPKNLEKEASILAKALAIISEEGLENLSMQKLAKAAGVSPRTIYIKYKDKEDFLVRLFVDEVVGSYEKAVLSGFSEEMAFAEGVRCLWSNGWHYFMAHREAFALMQYGRTSPLLNQAYRERNIEEGMFFAPVHRWIARLVGLGKIPDLPIAAYRALLFAPMLDLIQEHFEHAEVTTEDLFWTCCQTLIKGIQL
jgi:TetR/AcrR family transcriptional repressor of multidrug resistance operon